MATIVDKPSPPRERSKLSASSIERSAFAFVILGVTAAIVYGWANRSAGLPDPERGTGYALGIIGGSMMILLLGYPLRKRTRTKAMGSVGFWFRFHMLLGLLGPLAILYHSRFTFGSLNSAMALGSMIVVASSGLVGRFLYSRVHRGYSDRKLELRELKREMDGLLGELGQAGVARGNILERLQRMEDIAIAAGGAFWTSAWAVADLGIRSRVIQRKILSQLPRTAERQTIRLRQSVNHFFGAVRRSAEFAFYDRLLRLWHLLHLPLFVMLVAAAILHIVAVHMY